jgi:hypothetical protein
MGARWTDAERVIVGEIWRAPLRVEDQLHRLPGRTVEAVYREAVKLQLGAKTLQVRDPAALLNADKASLRAVMKTDKGFSMDEIYRESGIARGRLQRAIKALLEGEEVHISEYVGAYRTAHFRLGKGVNAVKPDGMSAQERRRLWEKKRREAGIGAETDEERAARLDAKYRLRECPWWPKADVVVGNAMRAMVQAGRAGL